MSVKTSQSSLKYHLDKFHPSWREKTRSAQPILNSFVRRKFFSLGLTSDERKKARRQLIRLIILECLPLRFVESPEFRSLVNFYNSSAESISGRTLAREFGKQHALLRESVNKHLLVLTSKLAITTDLWTSTDNTKAQRNFFCPLMGVMILSFH
ncbi:hypothetical protein P9112_005661 [Eukaryota sp. TZLM1-RC]